jgi:hypothetical protein
VDATEKEIILIIFSGSESLSLAISGTHNWIMTCRHFLSFFAQKQLYRKLYFEDTLVQREFNITVKIKLDDYYTLHSAE